MPQNTISPELLDLLEKHGEVFEDNQLCANTEEIQKNIMNKVEDVTSQFNTAPTFAYGSGMSTPLPGKQTNISDISYKEKNNKTLKEAAEDELRVAKAMAKLKKEKELENSKPMQQRVREYYVEQYIKQQKQMYFEKHGFELPSKTIRTLKRDMERKLANGRVRINDKMYADIVDFLNSPLNDPTAPENVNKLVGAKNNGTAQNLTSLMSSSVL